MRKPRRNHSPAFASRVALEPIRGEKTMAEIAAHHEVRITQVTAWKTELLENAAAIFGGDVVSADGKERIRDPQAKIGELTMENSFDMVLSCQHANARRRSCGHDHDLRTNE